MRDPRTDTGHLAAPLAAEAADDAVDALVVDVVEIVEAEPYLRVAPDSVRRRRHVRIAAAAAAVSISATLFAVVGFNVELAQHQIQLQHLQSNLDAAQTQYYDLRNEVAQLSSPREIQTRAQHLGLVGPQQPTNIVANVATPPADPTGTAKVQQKTSDATRNSLDPVQ